MARYGTFKYGTRKYTTSTPIISFYRINNAQEEYAVPRARHLRLRFEHTGSSKVILNTIRLDFSRKAQILPKYIAFFEWRGVQRTRVKFTYTSNELVKIDRIRLRLSHKRRRPHH